MKTLETMSQYANLHRDAPQIFAHAFYWHSDDRGGGCRSVIPRPAIELAGIAVSPALLAGWLLLFLLPEELEPGPGRGHDVLMALSFGPARFWAAQTNERVPGYPPVVGLFLDRLVFHSNWSTFWEGKKPAFIRCVRPESSAHCFVGPPKGAVLLGRLA